MLIKAVTFDFSSRDRRAPGSDNWPVTWADDGHQYAVWGDGGGFGGTNSDGRVSLGVARIEGSRDNHRGYNVWGGKNAKNPARFGGKSYGILCVDGVLTMWVGPGSGTTSYREARVYKSADHGATWSKADWAFTKSDRLIMPTFCQFGKNYAGARDSYVYCYFIRLQGNPSKLNVHKPGQIDLARVPKKKIMHRSAYEFFDGKGDVLVTGRGQGCPYVVDYNGDGLLDIVLGGKFKPYSGPGAIWLFPNTGSQKKPAFNKSDAYQVPIPGMPEIGCG